MKKFLNKKVMDIKFRRAGEGHRLDEEKKPHPPSPGGATASGGRSVPSVSSASAGEAAIARLEGERPTTTTTSRRARDDPATVARKKPEAVVSNEPPVVVPAVGSVIIRLVCPICKRSVPYSDVQDHMATCLQEEYIKEPLTSSVQMIHTLCTDASRRKACIDTINKYLDNIIDHPGDEKYRKIRIGNKTFSERVLTVSGAELFLEAIGFQQTLLPHQDSEEQFYVLFPVTTADTETTTTAGGDNETESGCGVGGASSAEEMMSVYRELLSSSEPLRPAIDRQVTLFRSSPHVTNFDLSDDFYQLSLEEIRREQKLKSVAVESSQQLRTKAMRGRDEVRAVAKYYRYTLLRVRLPDGLILQAAFRPLEKLQSVREVLADSITDKTLTFSLSAFGQPLNSDQHTLAQLGLVPSAVLNLSWNGIGPNSGQPYLEPELLERIQNCNPHHCVCHSTTINFIYKLCNHKQHSCLCVAYI